MKKFKFLLLCLVALVTMPAAAQMSVPQLPADTAVRIGKLPNGLTYYVRHNALPANRANFYIAQKVGSVQEEDNQRGLAHFLEHMCFNGTDHFPDNTLTKYCENIGVMFGQDLNAYTSTDETVYNIDNVPVTPSNVDSCLLILRDWADGLTLAPTEIDKERGVIHEEWRLRSSATMRIFERNLPTLYPGSRYAYRFPIGTMEVVDNFKPQELRDYYEKWYRPDLQGIIIVGDINADEVVEKIKKLFSPIKMPENAAKYEHYPVPNTPQAIYVVDKDKEQSTAVVNIMFKHDVIPTELNNTMARLGYDYISSVIASVVNARLAELTQKADCPFATAMVENGNYIVSKTMGAFSLVVLPKPGQDVKAVQTAMEELERAAQFGLTGTEIQRAKEEIYSAAEAAYNNRNKQQNSYYVPKYVRNFLENMPACDIETEFNLYKMLQQQLPAESFSATLKEFVASTDSNFVFLAMYPDKEGISVPTTDDFKAAVKAAKEAKLEAYVDNVKQEPLVPVLPKKGKIKKEEGSLFGYKCWTLKNGARVFYRQTDFNESEVNVKAFSWGGSNKLADKDIANSKLFNMVFQSTGLGNFNATELQKKLAGKQASVNASLSAYSEGLSGSSTPKDLRTLFELIYLRFQTPANDPDAYNSLITALRTTLANQEKVPETAFRDSIFATLYDHNARQTNLHVADLDNVNYDELRRIYSERFNAAGDFDFVFTGNFNVDTLRSYVEQYIAPLKAAKKRESITDLNIRPAKGIINNRFVRAMETPKATIARFYMGETPYSLKTAAVANALGQILTQRYLKSIREEGGLAYSVGAAASVSHDLRDEYAVQVFCPVKPAQMDSALLLMDQGINDIAEKGVTAEEIEKVVKYELKTFADNQKENAYWEGNITNYIRWNNNDVEGYEEAYKTLTSAEIQKFAKEVILGKKNCITVTMLPASMKE